MIVIKPRVEFITPINRLAILKRIEEVGRVCYKSEDLITEESAPKFVEMLIKRGHEAMIEHVSLSVKFVCDRGVSHEIVRHRVASYAQESTRYCNYSKDKFDNQLTFIEPCFFHLGSDSETSWGQAMQFAEMAYFTLLDEGAKPEEARSVLPNSLKTEIIVTMNLREWRHFFKLRTAKTAHPQMREVAIMAFDEFNKELTEVFSDIEPIVYRG